ncbi:MAG: polyphosphate kinase 2 family protein [Pirellulales bacterium]|nr:polyphosphate kinase 2 family protein [Pirellulales bacterium]
MKPPQLQPITVPPGTRICLDDFDPGFTDGHSEKQAAQDEVRENTITTAKLAHRLYAENRRAMLLVLQGMDTSGKDGTIRHVMSGINPQSCRIVSFKQPSLLELDHDFLWRIHQAVPPRGNIGIFNRSHYEDVLVVRVHKLVPESVWRPRYDRINSFERMLVDGNITLVKCFLHISKKEQRNRLKARLGNPEKRWKFSHADLEERKKWNEYIAAYEEALTRCNTDYAPWHIFPSDHKWYRNLVVSRIIRQTLEKLDPQFPPFEAGLDEIVIE